jgi:hypothetical protein
VFQRQNAVHVSDRSAIWTKIHQYIGNGICKCKRVQNYHVYNMKVKVKSKVGPVLSFLDRVPRHEGVLGSGAVAPHIL